VYYYDVVVGEYFADLLVEGVLLVELTAVKALDDAHRTQCTNYLKATGLRLCLLLNFGKPRLDVKRVVQSFVSRTESFACSACICAFICVKTFS
jgi:GxxExxY protein